MVSGAGLAAAAGVVATGAVLVLLLARLARAARRAEAARALDGAWPLPAAAAALVGLGAALRVVRYALDAPPSLPEVVLASGATAGGAFLLHDFLQRAHRAARGAAPEGAALAGAILLAASLASGLVALGKPALTLQVTLALGVELGALAWALSTVALHAATLPGEPAWVAAFARAGSQALVGVAFARALLAGPGNLGATRLVLAFGVLAAVALAVPALAATAHALGRAARA